MSVVIGPIVAPQTTLNPRTNASNRRLGNDTTTTGAAYVLIFLGAAPLIIVLALLLQILWLPLAALVMIIRVSRHRRCRPNVLIYPLTAAAMLLDLDGE